MPEKLTLTAYLEQRGKKAKALRRCEAEAFGIPYPLQSGWPAKHGSMEITEAMLVQAASRIKAAKEEAREKVRADKKRRGTSLPETKLDLNTQPTAATSPVPGFVSRLARRYRIRNPARLA